MIDLLPTVACYLGWFVLGLVGLSGVSVYIALIVKLLSPPKRSSAHPDG